MTETTTTTKTRAHWKFDKNALKTFWAAAGRLGIDEYEAHVALSEPDADTPIDSLEDFGGNLAEAIACLSLYESGVEKPESGAPAAPPAADPSTDTEEEATSNIPELPEEHPHTGQPLDFDALASACVALPESPVIAWTNFIDRRGFKWSATVRAGLPQNLEREAVASIVRQVGMFASLAEKYDWVPEAGLFRGASTPMPRGTTPAHGAPPPSTAGAAPPAPGASAAPPAPYGSGPQDAPQQQQAQGGTAQLTSIKVDADGRIELYAAGMRYPLKWHFGADRVVSELFQEGSGWTVEHFYPGAKYEALSGWVMDWAKEQSTSNQKWYRNPKAIRQG